MSVILDFVIELAMEVVMEVYLYLASALFPDKSLSARGKKVIKAVSAVVAIVFLVLLVFGVALLIDKGAENVWGWICTALGAAFLVATVTLRIVKR